MIRRRTLALDRFATFVAGLVLLALGAAAVAWWGGWLQQVWSRTPDELTLRTASDVLSAAWWPATAVVGGVVLGLLALWWLAAHRTHRSTGPVRLEGSGPGGQLLLVGTAAVSAAAGQLAEARGVRNAKGRFGRDRGQLVADVQAVVDPAADLDAVADEAERALADLAVVMGRPDVVARVRLVVAQDSRPERRVE